MQSEPESGIRFQREMSLKVEEKFQGILLVNDNHHAEPRAVEFRGNPGVSGWQPEIESGGRGSGCDLLVHRASAESAAVSAAGQRATRHHPKISAQGNRAEPGADNAVNSMLDAHAARGEAALPGGLAFHGATRRRT